MPTINQLIRKPRKVKKARRRKNLALDYWKSSRSHSSSFHDSPQKAGTCLKIGKTKPRKPNSALRSTARIELTNGREVSAYIPGEGHNLQEHDKVLIQGGRIQDLPGVKYVVIRGVRDTEGVKDRKQGRSLYGKKKDKGKKNN